MTHKKLLIIIVLLKTLGSYGQYKKSWQKACAKAWNPYSITDESNNLYIVATYDTMTGNNNLDYMLAKYNSSGDLIWKKFYSGIDTAGYNQEIPIGIFYRNKSIYITGFSRVYGVYNSYNDFWTIKCDAGTGDSLWSRRFAPGTSGYPKSAVMDNEGSVYITGMYDNASAGTYNDMITIKYDMNGNLKWQTLYDGGHQGHDIGNKVIVDNKGYVYVTGGTTAATFDVYTVKYDAGNGTEVWSKTYEEGYTGEGMEIVVDDAGDVYVAGQSGQYNFQSVFLSYDSNGNEKWTKDPGIGVFKNSNLRNPSMLIDNCGNINLIGGDATTVKYNSAGTKLWSQTLTSLYVTIPFAIAVDECCNVFTVGRINASTSGPSDDIFTIKYQASNGTPLWSDNNLNGEGRGISLGNNGCIYTTGDSLAGSFPNSAWQLKVIAYCSTVTISSDFSVPSTCDGSLPVEFSSSTGSEATSWFWNFGDGSTSTAKDTSHTYSSAQSYTVSLSTRNSDCSAYGYTEKTVTIGSGGGTVDTSAIPNIFTPNNDGDNDYFFITGSGINNYHLRIYDRWGFKMFDSVNLNEKWDGTTKNKAAPAGIYFYTMDMEGCEGGTSHPITGSVMLLK